MNSARLFFLCVVSDLALTSCAVQRYQAAPIAPVETASSLESRSLSDAALQSFVEKSLGQTMTPWPPKLWDLQTASLIALYFSPDMQVARARLEGAEAAIVTAGARPNPIFDFSPGVPSPYLLALDFAVPLETKRRSGESLVEGFNGVFELALIQWVINPGRPALLLERCQNLLLLGGWTAVAFAEVVTVPQFPAIRVPAVRRATSAQTSSSPSAPGHELGIRRLSSVFARR